MNQTENNAKAAIRQERLAARQALSFEDWAERGRAVCQRLAGMDEFRDAATVLTYVSSKDHEVDTRALIESMLTKDVRVLVPIAAKDRRLTWSRLEGLSELGPGRFGIVEPLPGFVRQAHPPDSAVVLVPGIAFTPEGRRIGYGGGYFDRFLAAFGGVSIGLAFDSQILRLEEADAAALFQPHDVPVGVVVTESSTYRTRGD